MSGVTAPFELDAGGVGADEERSGVDTRKRSQTVMQGG